MNPTHITLSRREFLAQAAAGVAGKSTRLIIDTHLEVWTIDPKFPFHNPEHPDARPEISAPVENEVEEMREFGLRYAVLINERDYGWDNSYISYSLHKYPDRFVAHGLINPEDPKVADRLRYWVKEHGFQGMRFSPLYHPNSTWLNSKAHYPLWREAEKLGAVFNFYILPHQMPMLEDMAGRFPGVKVVVDHLGRAGSQRSRSLEGFPQDVSPEKVSPGLDQRLRALRNLAPRLPVSRYVAFLQSSL